MFEWLVGVYAVIMFALIGSAGCIALLVSDSQRRGDGYRVLRLLLTAGTTTGVFWLLVRLHQMGRSERTNMAWPLLAPLNADPLRWSATTPVQANRSPPQLVG